MLQEINQRGMDISRFVAKSLGFSVVGYDYHTIQLLLDEITFSEDIEYAKVTNTKGNTMAESGLIENLNPENVVLFSQDIVVNDTTVGRLTLGLSTLKTIQRLEMQKFSLVAREALIILLIAIGEFLALSYIIIRPVGIIRKSLNDSINEQGLMTSHIPLASQDEFGQLASQFNFLRSQLNDANVALQSKIDIADQQLIETNRQLIKQSDELKLINEKFKHMSITDPLTGLYNRRHFEELMETEIAMSVRYGDPNSLLVLDIDHFKTINDTHGHFGGDIILKEVADLLKKNMRRTDILCRIGGEEFVAFCKRSDKRSAMEIAENLRKCVEKFEFDLGDKKVHITASVGVSSIQEGMKLGNKEELFMQADIALYNSKRTGRNKISHYTDISPEQKTPKLQLRTM